MVRRALIALAVLSLLVGLSPSAAARGKPQQGEVLALTYNVAGLTEQVSGSQPATNSALISPLLNAYELVLLQEDWEDPLEQLGVTDRPTGVPLAYYHSEIVSEADHPHQSEPGTHPYGTDLSRAPSGPALISDGLNRLSDLPFGELTRVMWASCHGDLAFEVAQAGLEGSGAADVLDGAGLGAINDATDGGASDCAAQKGFSVARTELAPGVEVDVYNLHADAGAHPRDGQARVDNFEQLAAFISERSAGRALLIGGDTNLKVASSVPERAALDAVVLEDFVAATGVTDVCSALDCGADAAIHDKFFFRSGSGVTLAPLTHRFERETFTRDGEPLSDHDPLAVSFRWNLSPTGRRG